MASTAQELFSTTATTSSSSDAPMPSTCAATFAATYPMARPGQRCPWNRTASRKSSGRSSRKFMSGTLDQLKCSPTGTGPHHGAPAGSRTACAVRCAVVGLPFLHQFGEVFQNPCCGSPNVVSLPTIGNNLDWFSFDDPRLFSPAGRVEKNFQRDSQESGNLSCAWPKLVRVRNHTHEWDHEKACSHSVEIIQFPHHSYVLGIDAYLLGQSHEERRQGTSGSARSSFPPGNDISPLWCSTKSDRLVRRT